MGFTRYSRVYYTRVLDAFRLSEVTREIAIMASIVLGIQDI